VAAGVERAGIGGRRWHGTAGTSRSEGKGEAQAAQTARREYQGGALGRTDSYERRRPCNGVRAKGSGQGVAGAKQLVPGGS
jgi:hypothetical protein